MSEPMGMGAAMPEDNQNPDPSQGMTAGEIMRQAREAHGVHIASLAVALKVPVSKIDALEEGRYDEFPDNVFMRALAASVCRTLKIEPAPVLALLPSGAPQALNVTRGLNASFRDPQVRFKMERSLERPNKTRWIGAAVAVLLVGALAVAFFPSKDASLAGSGATTVATTEDSQTTPESTPPQEAAVTAEAAASEAAVTPAVPAASAPVVAAATTAPASVPLPAGDPAKVLEIRAREASWVKIVSSVNGVVLQRELTPGESVVAAGSPPWHVTVGRPDATEVIVRGEPMSMSNYPRGSVARFEVK